MMLGWRLVRVLTLGAFVGAVATTAAAAGCNSDVTTGAVCAGACLCSTNSCRCNPGASCMLGPRADGGVAADALPRGTTYDCDSHNTCTTECGDDCNTNCDGQSMCTGACGRDCSASCTGASTCSLNAGPNSTISCEGGSHCEISAQDGSMVSCTGASTCHLTAYGRVRLRCDGTGDCRVACPSGGCELLCDGDAPCTLVCGGSSACHTSCGGNLTECAAGSTCVVDPCQSG